MGRLPVIIVRTGSESIADKIAVKATLETAIDFF